MCLSACWWFNMNFWIFADVVLRQTIFFECLRSQFCIPQTQTYTHTVHRRGSWNAAIFKLNLVRFSLTLSYSFSLSQWNHVLFGYNMYFNSNSQAFSHTHTQTSIFDIFDTHSQTHAYRTPHAHTLTHIPNRRTKCLSSLKLMEKNQNEKIKITKI